jgi:hypothetical protein
MNNQYNEYVALPIKNFLCKKLYRSRHGFINVSLLAKPDSPLTLHVFDCGKIEVRDESIFPQV